MLRGFLRVIALTIVSVLLISGAFLGGFAASRQLFPPAPLPDGGAPTEFKPYMPVYWEAWNYVHQDFYKPNIDESALVNGTVAGMVDALGDPHTAFVDAKRAANQPNPRQKSNEKRYSSYQHSSSANNLCR